MLKAALVNREIEKGRALDDTESRQVVTALVKQRRDSIEQFTRGGRQDLADKEAAEIACSNRTCPPPPIRQPSNARSRGHRRDRRRLAKRYRPRDESRHGEAVGPES